MSPLKRQMTLALIALQLTQTMAFAAGTTPSVTTGMTVQTTQAAQLPQPVTTKSAQGGKLDFDSVCGDVMGMQQQMQEAGKSVNTQATQKLEYCNAAKDSKK